MKPKRACFHWGEDRIPQKCRLKKNYVGIVNQKGISPKSVRKKHAYPQMVTSIDHVRIKVGEDNQFGTRKTTPFQKSQTTTSDYFTFIRKVWAIHHGSCKGEWWKLFDGVGHWYFSFNHVRGGVEKMVPKSPKLSWRLTQEKPSKLLDKFRLK